ncbi:hypothetical protein [Papillibacter cinnamivorans]|uniref:hypothetical protein n=1 Tax=Papillibacter cinnamivorans TaxID=100176 RepID=UPI0013566843|nr:hypothetical protein [Papillibacter cinnamivorans]
MRKSILLDTVNALLEIRKYSPSEEIDAFLLEALTGTILDSKSKRQIREVL